MANTPDMASDPYDSVSAVASRLHRSALVCDFTLPFADIGDPRLKRETLPRFRNAGVDCVSLTVGGDTGSLSDTIKLISKERQFFLANTDQYVLVRTADDIPKAKSDGKLAVIFHFQGTDPLEGRLDLVDTYYQLGVRHMLLAYNTRNQVGDGCFEPNDAGLSLFGRKLVARMNRAGMIVDCSHTGYRTSLEAMEISDSPVIFSHANPFGMHEHPRNIRDDQLQRCADTGGVVGILGISNMLGAEGTATADRVAQHIDYCVQKIGVDHVGISLDYVYDPAATYLWAVEQAGGELPKSGNYSTDLNLVAPEAFPSITQALLDLEYAEADIQKILGGNWLRVCDTVWK